MLYHGQVQVLLDLEDQERVLHMQHKWQQKLQLKAAMEHGLKSIEVYVKGPGSGREAKAIRSLQAAGLEVTLIKRCYSNSS